MGVNSIYSLVGIPITITSWVPTISIVFVIVSRRKLIRSNLVILGCGSPKPLRM